MKIFNNYKCFSVIWKSKQKLRLILKLIDNESLANVPKRCFLQINGFRLNQVSNSFYKAKQIVNIYTVKLDSSL